MKISKLFLAVALCGATLNVLAKDAAPSGASKPFVDSAKRERRQALPEASDLDARWQPYLRWHRDATALANVALCAPDHSVNNGVDRASELPRSS